MRRLTAAFALLLLAACTTTSPVVTSQYDALDCAALEQERLKLVAALDAMSAADFAGIEKTRADIEAVGEAQVKKGCAG